MLKRFLAFFLCLPLLFSFTACDSTDEAYIYMELKETLNTVDPQIASTESELLIVRNIFEGLMRVNSEGKIVPAAAKSYTKSGLVYTFELNKNLLWSDGTKLTAYDFEFGIKRALLPETKSPFAERLYSIEGAKAIHTTGADVSNLGVIATNDTTLVIELEYEDPQFLKTLTTSVAMPCNKEFFNKSNGQYGLFAKHILSNGSYEFSHWRKDPFGVRLYKNEYYKGEFVAKNAAVFLTCDIDETPFERLSKNNVDIAFIETAECEQAKQLSLNTYEINNICWFLTINNEFTPNTRKALAMLVGGEVYSKNLTQGYTVAGTIYPESLELDFSPNGITAYNLEGGKQLFSEEIKYLKDNRFPADVSLYYYDSEEAKTVINDIVGHWQSNLSAFVNIKPAGDLEYLNEQLKNQTYQMAFFPVKLKSGRLDEYYKLFGYQKIYTTPETAQVEILRNNNIVPVMFQSTVFSYSNSLTGVNPQRENGYIDFSFIIKT